MTNEEISQIIRDEVNARTWGVTRQFLEIHDLVYQDGKPLIGRIDRDNPDGPVIAYLPVKDEKFHLAVVVENGPAPAITAIYVEPYGSVYFRASSELLDLAQLSSLTHLSSTSGWNTGDKKWPGHALHKDSCLRFEPNPEPDTFEDKLDKLLDFLEQDPGGIKRLAAEAGGYIQVALIFHNGNTMLCGLAINAAAIRRMATLGLAIDFDLYAEGNFYK